VWWLSAPLLGAYALAAATFRVDIDGPPAGIVRPGLAFAAAGLLGAAAALASCGCAFRPAPRAGDGHRVTHATAAALLVAALLVLPAVHAVRWFHPANTGQPYWLYDDAFDAPAGTRLWRTRADGSRQIAARDGALEIRSAPGAPAYLEAAFLTRDPARFPWLQPAWTAAGPFAERVEWTASYRRDGAFLMLVEAWFGDRLLWLQATEYGLHVTFPDASGVRQGYEIRTAAAGDGMPHAWSLERDQTVALTLDGNRLWEAPDSGARGRPGPITQLRFGDTISDPAHGGVLRLETIHYERRAAQDRRMPSRIPRTWIG
jgi:hypothetical protein